jgi:hypothetical protein
MVSSHPQEQIMLAALFLMRYRDEVLALARHASTKLPGDPRITPLVERIHADEQLVDVMPPRRDMLPGENAFWFCVMQLEEFAEMTWKGAAKEPYVQYLLQDLRDAADALAHNRELPPGLMVHWDDPDDDPDLFWAKDQMISIHPMPVLTELMKQGVPDVPSGDLGDRKIVH